jgi:hypothetical protein
VLLLNKDFLCGGGSIHAWVGKTAWVLQAKFYRKNDWKNRKIGHKTNLVYLFIVVTVIVVITVVII